MIFYGNCTNFPVEFWKIHSWKEGDVSRQLYKVPLRGYRALLHIQQVAHGLKQVEGNAQRQNDVQGSHAAQPKGPGEGGDEEIVILAEAQQGKTRGDAARQCPLKILWAPNVVGSGNAMLNTALLS